MGHDLSGLSVGELKAHVARLEALRSPASLGSWLDPSYRICSHTRLIGDELSRLRDPDGPKRLMILAPPRSGKSHLVTQLFPLWWLTHRPGNHVVAASYGADLAAKWGRSVRGMVNEWGPRLGLSMSSDVRSAKEWRLVSGGGMKTVGVGSGITGHDADLLLCDDPIKDRAEAESRSVRDAVDDWWSSTFTSRQSPGTPICLILCVVSGERVLMGDGSWRCVEDVRAGDRVVSLGEDRCSLRTGTVVRSGLSGFDSTFTVRTKRHVVKVNGDHPFAVLDRGKFRPSGFVSENVEWVRARDLAPGDRVLTVKSLPDDHVGVDVVAGGGSVVADVAWLLGYFLSCGRVDDRGAVEALVGVSRVAEKSGTQERVRDLLSRWSGCEVYWAGRDLLRVDWGEGARVLEAMGYGVEVGCRRVPDVVWRWSVECRRAFIEGFVWAVGSRQRANYSRVWRVTSVNRSLLDDVRDLALTCGVRPTSVLVRRKRVDRGRGVRESVPTGSFGLGLTFIPDAPEAVTMLSHGRHPAPRHIRYERVTSVEEGLRLPVYDLTVEGTETFCAEGFLVHNTPWHEDDIAARLLDRERDLWRVIRLPAYADSADDPLGRVVGEALPHPKIADEDVDGRIAFWESRRRESSLRDWNALYMCNPQPVEGTLISEAHMDASIVAPGAQLPGQVRVAVSVDPSGGGKDEAGIVAGFAGEDGRCYITADRSKRCSSTEWAREVAVLAYDVAADVIFVETNFGGDMAENQIMSGWAAAEDEGIIPEGFLIPRIEKVRAKYGKRIRAEPVAQRWVQGDVKVVGDFPSLVREWTKWQPGGRESPGRIDSVTYLVQGLIGNTVVEKPGVVEPPIGESIYRRPDGWSPMNLW